MNDMQRMIKLSGMNPNSKMLEQLKKQRQTTLEAYDRIIASAEKGEQINEGLWTALKAAVSTVGDITSDAAKRATAAASKLATNVKEIYLDNKAQEELKKMVKDITMMMPNLEKLEKNSATILQRDPEIKKQMELFRKALELLVANLNVRLTIA